MTSEVFNTDCLEYMRTLPDKAFQLAIADPPYGIERFSHPSGGKTPRIYGNHPLTWDKAPDQEFFDELFRVCEYSIIWGGNNFMLPKSEYFIIWNKEQTVDNFASLEYAWTNVHKPAKMFTYSIHKCMQERKAEGGKVHPTQKPVALYAWLLKNYAKPGDRIFDPMMGSQSSRIAAYKMGFDYVGCELDKEYFDKGCERFAKECKGEIKLKDGSIVKQASLFDL